MSLFPRTLGASVLALVGSIAIADDSTLKLSGLFSDNMVLQREKPLKIWGTTSAGETVTVSLDNESARVKADADGKWEAELPARQAGGPYTLTVADSDETTSLKNILLGDVWVCSGQSNMDWALLKSADPEKAIREATNKKIRLYKVTRNKSLTPLEELDPASRWQVCSPETIPDFSAVGYYFGRELQQELDVPIGLIHTAWGGTRVESWTPAAGLKPISYYEDELKEIEAGISDADLKDQYDKRMREWQSTADQEDPGLRGDTPIWAATDFDDSEWKDATLPWMLDSNGYDGWDGTVWLRKTVTLTEEQAAKPMRITFCADDSDVTFINGIRVGSNEVPGKPRTHQIPAGIAEAGENTVTIRVLDVQKNGGICGNPEDIKIFAGRGPDVEIIPLDGEGWKIATGVSLDDVPNQPEPVHNVRATVLYNAMISPLVNFPIRGVIWYQGESNARNYLAPFYAQTLKNMIAEWRKAWRLGDFPFLQVQLASYTAIVDEPQESEWALLREAQEDVLELKNTAMASAIDIGDEKDIHPKNKMDVGKRLALGALALEYGKDIEYMGPIYRSHEIRDGNIIISFKHGRGLKTSGTKELKGFAISGADGNFVWADARIEGDTVVVSSSKVTEPKAVRYGWANYSTGNLYNAAGLPASPFRTDR